MGRSIRILVVSMGLLTSACSSASDKLTKDLQEANSWIASVRLVAEASANGSIPKPYTRDALESFAKQLQSTAEEMQSLSDARAAQAANAVRAAQQTTSQIISAVDRGDELSLAQFDAQLAGRQQALTTLLSEGTTPQR